MLATLLKPLSALPLSLIHRLGAGLGWLLYLASSKTKRHVIENMSQSNLFTNDLSSAARNSFISTGKAILETIYILNSDDKKVAKLIREVHGWDLVENSVKEGKGVICLTPHMGCFEIASLYYGLHNPITVLYRPPKKKWLTPILNGRKRPNITLAEANTNGVRKLLRALKKGESIGILPDQVPAAGEGEWADFFGKTAYTMSLASKLATKTDATVIMAFGERLDNGQGYALHLTKVDSIATPALLNKAIEKQIEQCPTQYYWSYQRYKVRRKSRAKRPH